MQQTNIDIFDAVFDKITVRVGMGGDDIADSAYWNIYWQIENAVNKKTLKWPTDLKLKRLVEGDI